MVINIAAAHGDLRDYLFCFGQRLWTPFHREARLKLDKELEWAAFAQDAKTDRWIGVVHTARADDTTDAVMAQEGEPVQVGGVERAWRAKAIRGEEVFFRPGPSMLGFGAPDLASQATALLRAATPESRPAVFVWVRGHGLEAAHLREKGVHEVRLSVASADDGGARVELDVELDRGAATDAVSEAIRGYLADASVDKTRTIVLGHASIDSSQGHVHAVLALDAADVRAMLIDLKYGKISK